MACKCLLEQSDLKCEDIKRKYDLHWYLHCRECPYIKDLQSSAAAVVQRQLQLNHDFYNNGIFVRNDQVKNPF